MAQNPANKAADLAHAQQQLANAKKAGDKQRIKGWSERIASINSGAFYSNKGSKGKVKNTTFTAVNPDIVGPTGTTTTGLDKNGNPIVTHELTPGQQQLLTGTENLGAEGLGLAIDRLKDPNNPLSKAWDGSTPTKRISDGDTMAARAAMEEAVFKRLTQNHARDKAKDREDLDQTLYNRGIPINNPDETLRKRFHTQLDERYDTLNENARMDATRMGLEEMKGLVGLNEQVIANQFDQTGKVRQQNLSETAGLASLGAGALQPIQPAQFTPTDPMADKVTGATIDNLKADTKLKNRTRPGGGTPAPTSVDSPFNV